MATRGRKPKLPELRIVDGNPGKRKIEDPPQIDERDEPLAPPRKLTKVQVGLWERFIDSAWWLAEHDVPKAYMWVCLQAEYNRSPAKMVASRIAQLRTLGSELGLDPTSRARMGAIKKKAKQGSGVGKYVT